MTLMTNQDGDGSGGESAPDSNRSIDGPTEAP